jgi:DNA-binding response OmpR family regulator
LDDKKPDMLILDLHLGATDTLKYVITIRSDATWQHLPILMTSAINQSRACLEAGANDFVLKPFNWQEMTQRVKKIQNDYIG